MFGKNGHRNPPLFLYEVLLEEYASFGLPLLTLSDIDAKRRDFEKAHEDISDEKERRLRIESDLLGSLHNLYEKRRQERESSGGRGPVVGGAHERELPTAAGEKAELDKRAEPAEKDAPAEALLHPAIEGVYAAVRAELAVQRKQREERYRDTIEDETERMLKIDGEMLPIVYKLLRDMQNGIASSKREEFAKQFDYVSNRAIRDGAVGDAVKIEGARTALCLSGGGIRSATFNLGILQGLARHGLLEKFDYLSTVSGGGFVGSWLSSWIHRRGLDEVVKELGAPAPSPVAPDARPVSYLRTFSNYLSPRVGLLSADTWTLVATFLRNLLLNWLVFLPVIMAALLFPRLWLAYISRQTLGGGTEYVCYAIAVLTGWVALTYIGLNLPSSGDRNWPRASFLWLCLFPLVASSISLVTFWARHDQNIDPISWTDFGRFAVVLTSVPWIISCIAIIGRGRERERLASEKAVECEEKMRQAPEVEAGRRESYKYADPSEQKHYRPADVERVKFPLWTYISILAAITLAIALALYLSGWIVHQIAILDIFKGPISVLATAYAQSGADIDRRLYATLAVPAMLLLLVLAGTFIAGFTSRWTKDEDQEWWARSGAWVLIVIVAWIALCALVLYAPQWFISIYERVRKLFESGGQLSQLAVSDYFTVLGGVGSLILTLLGGFSSKTPANEREQANAGLFSKLLPLLTNLAALILLVYVVVLLALITNVILVQAGTQMSEWLKEANKDAPSWISWLTSSLHNRFNAAFHGLGLGTAGGREHAQVVARSSLSYLTLWLVIFSALGGVMGWLINTNKFSLHYMWRNRIIRGYLGASRKRRRPNHFTDFDTYDNVPLYALRYEQPDAPPITPERLDEDPPHEMRSKKLLHVINIALNLAGSPRLAWQDRKAESFTVSPLHSGSFWTGYRRTYEYGGKGDQSISLGTAVAISGAFVSPNMGYMMTSPLVRFLMTLFNVRFGWWLGNPGYAGDRGHGDTERVDVRRTYDQEGPRLSVKPIVEEAFGYTNDKADYVYLSDGGHFENLGLYEMVVRRCRLIVVSDASTDASYSFQSLGMSIRQIRVDLGVPIELEDFSITPPSRTMAGKYCAIGKIRYSCVDKQSSSEPDDLYDGILVYIKPSLIGDEPRDVLNYAEDSPTFPQEVITDQWFSEAQFESYRELGSHIVNDICNDPSRPAKDPSRNKLDLATFVYNVRRHNQLNFRAFDEQIRFATFEEQVRELIKGQAPGPKDSFSGRVRDYINNITG